MFNTFQANVSFLYPGKRKKTSGFSDVFMGIEMEHWFEMS